MWKVHVQVYHGDLIYLRNEKGISNRVLSKNIYRVLFGDVINWDISISKEANSILNSELQLLMGVYLLRRKVVLSMQIDKKVILICLTSSLTAGFNFHVKLNSSKPENF